MIKAIFYDFDGVIKESTQIKTEAFYNLYLEHGQSVAEKAREHHLKNGGVSRYEKIKFYHKSYLGIDLTLPELERVALRFSDFVMKKVIESPYVPGAVEAIEETAKTQRLFIVTGTPQVEIDQVMDALEINRYFEKVLGSPKNKIELSAEIIAENGFEPHEVLFIGDALADYNAANHFNFHFILREHAENQALFQDINVVKSKDLVNLEALIENL